MNIDERLDSIEHKLTQLLEKSIARPWYTVEQFARIVGKATFTCREWCRLRRIHAEKSMTQTGASATWVISHEELTRYQQHGLLQQRREAS